MVAPSFIDVVDVSSGIHVRYKVESHYCTLFCQLLAFLIGEWCKCRRLKLIARLGVRLTLVSGCAPDASVALLRMRHCAKLITDIFFFVFAWNGYILYKCVFLVWLCAYTVVWSLVRSVVKFSVTWLYFKQSSVQPCNNFVNLLTVDFTSELQNKDVLATCVDGFTVGEYKCDSYTYTPNARRTILCNQNNSLSNSLSTWLSRVATIPCGCWFLALYW